MAALGLALFCGAMGSASAPITLGDAPVPPPDVSGLPGARAHALFQSETLNVDISSREQVREFYNGIYTPLQALPNGSSAVTAACLPGTNSAAYANATLLTINWFRAMAGVPAGVTFDAGESAEDQEAALMMSAEGELQHAGSWAGWDCYSSGGTNAAGNSNLALGTAGPAAIMGYMWDFGANNYEVGHRRYIVYPQTQIMGSGDVPEEGTNYPGNATWVFDGNYYGPRPATRSPFVAWPPPGYVPYALVYPQWSFALSNADLSVAVVTMSANGVPVPVVRQSYVPGFGENTVVWYPASLDPTSYTTVFPFGGTDTVYTVTVTGAGTAAGLQSYTYNVTLFDPATTGSDYFPLTITGTNTPSINAANPYTCTAGSNPNITGYQWLVAQATNGSLIDNAQHGTTNFVMSPPPGYPLIVGAPDGSGNCFHLTHTNPVPQLFQLGEVLFPSNTTTVSFKSLLGYATATEVARFQISTNAGSSWVSLWTEAGSGGPGEGTFTAHSFSLGGYAGGTVLARFDYDLSSGSVYPETNSYAGWCLENIVVTNTERVYNLVTNATAGPAFDFTPGQTGNYVLQAQGVIFGQFPIDWGLTKQVSAIVGPPVIALGAPTVAGGQVRIKFTLTSGAAGSFHLLQAGEPDGPWATNGTAVLTTNVPGSAWQFATTNGANPRFYRVQTP